LYTVIKFGVAGLLGLSLLSTSTGHSASQPDRDSAILDAPSRPAGDGPVVLPTSPVSANPDQIISAADQAAHFQAAMRDLIKPRALQRLVAMRLESPARPIGPDVECMAKVVYHEAANQALPGQLAVAQVIMNRVNGAATFAKTVCGVVNQSGQFFRTRRFRIPLHDRARWRTAVAIAALAQEQRLSQVVPGALFYHAAYVRPTWRHDHERIAQVGDQIFYR
jgi:spore germination cell wall hydrolase CwlJ-like protein